MLTLTDPPSCERALRAGRGVPSGPKGLWGALASASTPSIGARALPVSDTALLGAVPAGVMFDYDPALAVSLGDDLDVSLFLD